jgi:hypothetical protein
MLILKGCGYFRGNCVLQMPITRPLSFCGVFILLIAIVHSSTDFAPIRMRPKLMVHRPSNVAGIGVGQKMTVNVTVTDLRAQPIAMQPISYWHDDPLELSQLVFNEPLQVLVSSFFPQLSPNCLS